LSSPLQTLILWADIDLPPPFWLARFEPKLIDMATEKRDYLLENELNLVPAWNRAINAKYFELKKGFENEFKILEADVTSHFKVTDAICSLFEYEQFHHIRYGNCSILSQNRLGEFIFEFSFKLEKITKPSGCIYIFALYMIWKAYASGIQPSAFHRHISIENNKKHISKKVEALERQRIEDIFKKDHLSAEERQDFFKKYFRDDGNHTLDPELFADAAKHAHELGGD